MHPYNTCTMNAKANAQEEELLAVKLKTFEEEASKLLSAHPEAPLPWFIKQGLETTLQQVPKGSQL
jgi:hypothetical protein